jgi:hypothetical protein
MLLTNRNWTVNPMGYRKSAWCLAVSFGLLMIVAGCTKQPVIAEVEGVVKLKGKPLEDIHVEFWPETGRRSWGLTDQEGRFRLTTDENQKARPGVLVGKNLVSLRDTSPTKDDYISEGGDWVDMSKGRKSRIHFKYMDAMNSSLMAEVKPGQLNVFEFDVDPAPK